MWHDSTELRNNRYKKILLRSEYFYKPAVALEKDSKLKVMSENRQSVMLNTTAYVLGPAVCGYVLWVLKDALAKDVKRLYFLARDGYFMYLTAKILCRQLNIPIDCRYLCCSRYSVRIPMFHLNMNEALDYICRGGIDVTMDKILNRAGLSKEQKEKVLKELSRRPDDLIAYADLKGIRKELEASKDFMNFTKEHSRDTFPFLEGYLRQEGLLDDTRFSFVDSGWVGSMQKVIATAVNFIHEKDKSSTTFTPDGYYWGLYELPADVDSDNYHCYYFSEKSGVKRKIYFSNCLFESIFSAPHGMTLGYREKDGKFEPVFAQVRSDNKRFILKTQNYLERYAKDLAGSLKQQGIGPDNLFMINTQKERDITTELLNVFMGKPTYGEAYVYGSIPFSDDVLDINEQETAALLTQEELRSNHPWNKIRSMTGLSKARVKESAWYEGSAVRGRKSINLHLRSFACYKWMLYAKKRIKIPRK